MRDDLPLMEAFIGCDHSFGLLDGLSPCVLGFLHRPRLDRRCVVKVRLEVLCVDLLDIVPPRIILLFWVEIGLRRARSMDRKLTFVARVTNLHLLVEDLLGSQKRLLSKELNLLPFEDLPIVRTVRYHGDWRQLLLVHVEIHWHHCESGVTELESLAAD